MVVNEGGARVLRAPGSAAASDAREGVFPLCFIFVKEVVGDGGEAGGETYIMQRGDQSKLVQQDEEQ